MMRVVLLSTVALLGACAFDPVGAIELRPADQRYCDYIGKMHGNDEYGGIGQRAACMRYIRDTGERPPAI